jgi:hypothetical protein
MIEDRITVDARNTDEIRRQGIEALAAALGPVDAVRFLQIFDLGKCDYTKDRAKCLDIEIDEIVHEIERRKKGEMIRSEP